MSFVLGVDAGGTKTVAVVAGRDGQVRGVGRSGSANFQACGVAGAEGQIKKAVEEAAGQAGVDPSGFAAACYGVAGADRPKDFETIRKFVEPLTPCPAFRLENDTIIALRAGTADGVGIALIAGTGSNAIGRDSQGKKLGPDLRLSYADDFSLHARLLYNGAEYLVVWDDRRDELFSVYGQRVTSEGELLGRNVQLTELRWNAEDPHLAEGETTLGLAFKVGDQDNRRIGFRISNADFSSLGDLVLGTYRADSNGADAGSVWVMFSTLIDDEAGTGNNKPLDVAGNYNIRYDGAAAGD